MVNVQVINNATRLGFSPYQLPRVIDFRTSLRDFKNDGLTSGELYRRLEEPFLNERALNERRISSNRILYRQAFMDGFPVPIQLENRQRATDLKDLIVYLEGQLRSFVENGTPSELIKPQGEFKDKHLRDVLMLLGESGFEGATKIRSDQVEKLKLLGDDFAKDIQRAFEELVNIQLDLLAQSIHGMNEIFWSNETPRFDRQ